MSFKGFIDDAGEMSSHSDQANDIAHALTESFDAGPDAFEQQLNQLSDLQYVRLLTLLDEYSAPLRTW
jgi:hypothetical protein|tara:strand:- start:46 stop:249 length:204 start_codon:yes stop_codon:yes gene_type:complete